MRERYLLAAGLLTGLAIPASALSQMSIILPQTSKFVENSPQISQITANKKNIANPDISLPESLFNANSPPSHLPLTSGNQLYHQRLAALKTGQIYTRIDSHPSPRLWESSQKHQLTYQDWKNLLALEAKAISKGQGTSYLGILVGDSLSMWFPREKLPTGKLWLNQGISGDTSAGIFSRLRAFSATRPNVIYIMAGINDLRKGDSNEEILRNHRRIIRRLRQSHPKSQIIVQSILPTRLPTIPNSRIIQINTQLALIAEQEKADYLNIYHWFTDFQGNLRPELTTDGLHLSQDGYDIWRFALQQIELTHSGN
ncbi:SGNH/GDSL hydrolase family protein [Nodularia sp. NIES-3585]|uniref:SGNH/GDSL hydrolase family protein n=1 Tax=Nodularia sp. NIES-3585 TaxID=1973477 RepID=UPI000B67244D|nr:SGNH/GDSL hydrolase family protein [Nodularia sp. NIES-3585]GAX35223.1 GDSL family lipase [Nodularia sp. NIES-3585]